MPEPPWHVRACRYGLVALANSLDQVGPVTRTVLDAAMLHELIGGHDPLDSTSIDPPTVPGLFVAGGARADDPAAQRALIDVLAAPALGVRADQVPDLVDLLFGPLARGTTVRVS